MAIQEKVAIRGKRNAVEFLSRLLVRVAAPGLLLRSGVNKPGTAVWCHVQLPSGDVACVIYGTRRTPHANRPLENFRGGECTVILSALREGVVEATNVIANGEHFGSESFTETDMDWDEFVSLPPVSKEMAAWGDQWLRAMVLDGVTDGNPSYSYRHEKAAMLDALRLFTPEEIEAWAVSEDGLRARKKYNRVGDDPIAWGQAPDTTAGLYVSRRHPGQRW